MFSTANVVTDNFCHTAQQIPLTRGDRRISGQHEHRRIHRLQRLMGGLGVRLEHRPGAGRVDQLYSPASTGASR